jgi:hypothetical protein
MIVTLDSTSFLSEVRIHKIKKTLSIDKEYF